MRFFNVPLPLLVLFGLLALGACDKSKKNDDDDDSAIRFGDEIEIENIVKYDARAQISADGQNLTFISGRDKVLRVYKYTVGDDATPERLLSDSDGLDIEVESTLSPDGNWVIVQGIDSSEVNLFLKDFAGDQTIQQIADEDNGTESNAVFSEDSTLFAFIRQNSSERTSQLWVGKLDADGLDGDPVMISEEAESEFGPVFVPTGVSGSYKLASLKRDASGFTYSIVLRVLDAALSVSSSSNLVEGESIITDESLKATTEKVYFKALNISGDDYIDPVDPTGSFETKDTIEVSEVLKSVAIDDLSVETESLPGLAPQSYSFSEDAAGVGLFVIRDVFSCQKNLQYGSSLVSQSYADSSADFDRIRTPKSADDSVTVQSDVCDDLSDKGSVVFDAKLSRAQLAADSTESAYQVVYATLSTGDNEVWLLTFADDAFEVTNVSGN